MAGDGRLALKHISGSGAAPEWVLTWIPGVGAQWRAAASGLAIVDDAEPSSPAIGQLWYDTDDTC